MGVGRQVQSSGLERMRTFLGQWQEAQKGEECLCVRYVSVAEQKLIINWMNVGGEVGGNKDDPVVSTLGD